MTFVNLQGSIVLLHDNHKYNTCNRIWYVELWISCERFWTVSQTKWWKKKNIESWTKTKVTCKKHLRLCKKNVIYNGMRSAFLFSCYRRNVIKILSYSFSQLICTWFISFSLPPPFYLDVELSISAWTCLFCQTFPLLETMLNELCFDSRIFI